MFGKVDLVLQVGKAQEFTIRRKVPNTAPEEWRRAQLKYPQPVFVNSLNRTYWNFVNKWWWDNDGLSSDQVHALLVTQLQRQRGRIERAQAMVAMGSEPRPTVSNPG